MWLDLHQSGILEVGIFQKNWTKSSQNLGNAFLRMRIHKLWEKIQIIICCGNYEINEDFITSRGNFQPFPGINLIEIRIRYSYSYVQVQNNCLCFQILCTYIISRLKHKYSTKTCIATTLQAKDVFRLVPSFNQDIWIDECWNKTLKLTLLSNIKNTLTYMNWNIFISLQGMSTKLKLIWKLSRATFEA